MGIIPRNSTSKIQKIFVQGVDYKQYSRGIHRDFGALVDIVGMRFERTRHDMGHCNNISTRAMKSKRG